jgi:peptidoglycan/xylan/chitin deacetylase (PgdA/CDA1 family)
MNANHTSPPSTQLSDVMPRLTVIVASHSRWHSLTRVLASISEQDLPLEHYEVIIAVENGNDDREEYLRSFRAAYLLRMIEGSSRGLAAALNESIRAARGRIVLFTDDDVSLHPGNFRAHLDAHGTVDSLVAYGPVFVLEESADSLATELARQEGAEEIKRSEIGWTWPHDAKVGPNYSVSRSNLLAGGMFDEDFSQSYPIELGLRLTKMGLRFYYEPKAISHRMFESMAEQLVHIEARGKGREEIPLLRKHPELRPYSTLAGFADAPAWKRLAIQAATRFPVSPDLLLRPAFVLADRLRSLSSLRQLGLRLLGARITISFLRGAVESLGWRNLQGEFGRRLPVLMYHHVGPPQADSEPALFVSAARFEAQIRFLVRRGYVGIRPSDWLSWVRNAKPLPVKSVLLTFDDAIEELYNYAFPVLERYGFNAVVFVPTNCVGKGNLWNYPLGYKWRPCLTAEQIQYWSMKGVDFGAHSRNHPDLTQLEEPELQDEVAGSRSDLEQIIGSQVISFAYPYGLHNASAAACVQQHLDLGFTTDEGVNTLRTNRSLLRRVAVFDWDTLLELELMLRLGWNPVRRLRSRFRIRSRLSRLLRRMRILQN